MVEDNISEIFALLHQYQMRVEMIQNSAISFSICIYNKYGMLEPLLETLKTKFKVKVSDGVSLYTIRHFDKPAINFIKNKVGRNFSRTKNHRYRSVCSEGLGLKKTFFHFFYNGGGQFDMTLPGPTHDMGA